MTTFFVTERKDPTGFDPSVFDVKASGSKEIWNTFSTREKAIAWLADQIETFGAAVKINDKKSVISTAEVVKFIEERA